MLGRSIAALCLLALGEEAADEPVMVDKDDEILAAEISIMVSAKK